MALKQLCNFTFVVYDSSSIGWKERLMSWHFPGYYIFHDKDTKKPHYHVLMTSRGKYTLDRLNGLVEHVVGFKTQIQEVISLRGYARYLCHLDNPEKHQYSLSEVVSFGGTNYAEYINPGGTSLSMAKEIIQYCRDHDIYVYADLVDYCMEHNEAWFKYLICNNQGKQVLEYMKSRYWSNMKLKTT